MAKVTKQPVMTPEYKYVLELSEDEVHQLVALLGGCMAGTLCEVFDALDGHIPYKSRKYRIETSSGTPEVVRK